MTRRRFARMAATVAAVLSFLVPANVARPVYAQEGVPAAEPYEHCIDLGGGWCRLVVIERNGEVAWWGPERRIEPARVVPPVAMPVVYREGAGVDVPVLVLDAARRYGLDGGRMLRVAWCESKYNPGAVGDHGRSVGVFQFQTALWSTTPQGRAGMDRRNPAANIEAASWAWANGYRRHWSCQG